MPPKSPSPLAAPFPWGKGTSLKGQTLDPQSLVWSLKELRQLIEGATPEELKGLLPFFVKGLTWFEDRVDLCLFETFLLDGPNETPGGVNHSGVCSRSERKWLPDLGSNQGPSG